ncbi:MAG: DUF3810 family protein [Nanoarchaeota archaeon]|nr:DUF3810 family protein [Nanoarchaeota archaeon]
MKKDDAYRIPNLITYVPLNTSDLLLGGMIAFYGSRLLDMGTGMLPNDILPYANQLINWYIPMYSAFAINSTFAGMVVSGVIDNMLTPPISYQEDVSEKLGVRRAPVDEKTRKGKIDELCLMISDGYTEKTCPKKQEAKIANSTLEEITYQIEGVRVKTSSKIKNSYLMKYLMPHAIGGCNIISNDIEIYKQRPYISFSITAHELAHRRRYRRENDAEVLAHLAGFATKDPVFIQSSRVSRLRRECQTLFKSYDQVNKEERKKLNEKYKAFLSGLKIPDNIKGSMIQNEFKKYNIATRGIMKGQIALYKVMMKLLSRQKEGLKRYTDVFTEDLYALEKKYSSIENLAEELRR